MWFVYCKYRDPQLFQLPCPWLFVNYVKPRILWRCTEPHMHSITMSPLYDSRTMTPSNNRTMYPLECYSSITMPFYDNHLSGDCLAITVYPLVDHVPLYAYSITMYPLYKDSITVYPPLCLFNYHVPSMPIQFLCTPSILFNYMYPLYDIQLICTLSMPIQ